MPECEGDCLGNGPCCICGMEPEEAKKVIKEKGIKFPRTVTVTVEKP